MSSTKGDIIMSSIQKRGYYNGLYKKRGIKMKSLKLKRASKLARGTDQYGLY